MTAQDPGAPGSGDRGPRAGEPRDRSDQPDRPAPIVRIDRKMIVLLVAGLIAALLIFWFEPSFTLRYVVVGVLGVIYVFLRFNDWR